MLYTDIPGFHIEENSFYKIYFLDGKVHREDGPAIACKGWKEVNFQDYPSERKYDIKDLFSISAFTKMISNPYRTLEEFLEEEELTCRRETYMPHINNSRNNTIVGAHREWYGKVYDHRMEFLFLQLNNNRKDEIWYGYDEVWMKNGRLHRIEGPSLVKTWALERDEWFIDGHFFEDAELKNYKRTLLIDKVFGTNL